MARKEVVAARRLGALLFLMGALAAPLVVLAAKPEQMHLTLTPDDREMIVWWMSTDEEGPSTVEYGVTRDRLDEVATSQAEPFRYSRGRYTSKYIHEVKLEGLWRGGQEYFYRCGSPEGGWSDIYKFRTRRRWDTSVKAVVISDQGVEGAAKSVVTTAFSKLSTYDFWLHLGDISYADGDQAVWDEYGKMMEKYTARLPGALAVGNHEEDDSDKNPFEAFLTRWRNGETGDGDDRFVWSFNYGPMHIIMASSEHGYRDDTQTKILEADLIEANKPGNRLLQPWIVVAFHRPFFSMRKVTRTADRNGIMDLLERYNVDVVLTGHCHNYERQYPHKFESQEVTTRSKGTMQDPYITHAYDPQKVGSLGAVHLILGTAGQKVSSRCERQRGLTVGDMMMVYGHGEIEADRQQLVFKFVEHTGKVLDQFKLCARERCAPAPSPFPSSPPPPPKVWWVKPASPPVSASQAAKQP